MPVSQVNNQYYRQWGHCWWDDEVGGFSSIRFFINPIRFGYFNRVISRSHFATNSVASVLDVGCGGGFLAEEFAREGLRVTGIDPAPESINAARLHASESGLDIVYEIGSGESLPFEQGSFDIVACCDVLEHVNSVEQVIGEIARVLTPGGLFFYDTVNRTLKSKLGVIKVMQVWPWTAFVPRNAHVWNQFIRPSELIALFQQHGLDNRDMRGISPGRNPIAVLLELRRRARGEIDFKELGRRLRFRESNDLNISYMGFAVKRS